MCPPGCLKKVPRRQVAALEASKKPLQPAHSVLLTSTQNTRSRHMQHELLIDHNQAAHPLKPTSMQAIVGPNLASMARGPIGSDLHIAALQRLLMTKIDIANRLTSDRDVLGRIRPTPTGRGELRPCGGITLTTCAGPGRL